MVMKSGAASEKQGAFSGRWACLEHLAQATGTFQDTIYAAIYAACLPQKSLFGP